MKSNKITYDDTKDASIIVIEKLINLGTLEDNDDHYFKVQDTIQDEFNELLQLDIDDNFESHNKISKMKKYCMYVVDTWADDFDKSIADYDEVTNFSFDYTESDDLESLLRLLVSSINNGEYSDENWYFIADESSKTIIIN